MDRDLELRHLRYFIAVAEHLHFGRAAQHLHLAQPALSQQIRRLEDLLGYSLFTRTSRSVAITPAGQVLLVRARRSLHLLASDLEEVRSVGRGEIGSLRVGFIGSGMLTALPRVLHRYRKRYPKVELQLHESYTAQVLLGLQEGRLDAGLLRDSDAASDLHREPLFTEPYVAVLPRSHPLAHRHRIRPAVLRHEPFVFYARSAGTLAYDKPLSLCAADGFRPRVVQEASHWLTILRLIEAGFGVSIAPNCVRSIASEKVVCLPLLGVAERSTVELAYRNDESRPIVAHFAALVRGMAATGRSRSPTGA